MELKNPADVYHYVYVIAHVHSPVRLGGWPHYNTRDVIQIQYRRFDSHIKSLVHFDYPYYAENSDGLGDEILGLNQWSRSGSAKLAGSEIPADEIIEGTPKFGYRCLMTSANSDFIQCSSTVFSIPGSGSFEFSFWVRPRAHTPGNILQLFNNSQQVFSLSLLQNGSVSAASSAYSLAVSSTQTLPLNAWSFIRLRVSGSSVSILIGSSETQSSITRTALTVTQIRLGGINGFIDEFMFRNNLSSSEIPSEPAKGYLTLPDIGGAGSGKLGSVTLSSAKTLNTTAAVLSWPDSKTCRVSTIYNGDFGSFTAGEEVMILNTYSGSAGSYVFRKIQAASGSTITLDSPVTDFGLDASAKTQLIQIPHFGSLTVNAGVTISPLKWNGETGGIAAFRVKNNCTILGSILTHGLGMPRTDMLQLTHAKLIDTFLPGQGGGIFIVCGGTLTVSSAARLGASWDGAGKGGVNPRGSLEQRCAGSGYGGAGASDDDSASTGSYGGVGGGGGGANSGPSGNTLGGVPGADGRTGGNSKNPGVPDIPGGTQGVTPGGSAETASLSAGAGGGAGGCGSSTGIQGAIPGANIVIIAKTLKADLSAISTGGQGGTTAGSKGSHIAGGGAGTGFCYIACGSLGGNS